MNNNILNIERKMSFSIDFSTKISEGVFECLDEYKLSHSISRFKTYSDLCSLSFTNSLITVDSIQGAINIIKKATNFLLEKPQSFIQLNNISNFIFIKIIFSQLNEIIKTISNCNKNYMFINERENDFSSFSRQETKENTQKTKEIIEIATPTFKKAKLDIDNSDSESEISEKEFILDTSKNDIGIKDMLSAVQEMKERQLITNEEREILKEKIIEKDEEFISIIGRANIREKNKDEIIRNMRRYLNGFY